MFKLNSLFLSNSKEYHFLIFNNILIPYCPLARQRGHDHVRVNEHHQFLVWFLCVFYALSLSRALSYRSPSLDTRVRVEPLSTTLLSHPLARYLSVRYPPFLYLGWLSHLAPATLVTC